MSTGQTCADCGRVHPSDAARAISRFGTRRGFRAAVPDAPIRPTRAEAERDWCEANQPTRHEEDR